MDDVGFITLFFIFQKLYKLILRAEMIRPIMISITTYKIYTIWRSVVEYALVRVMNVELFFELCCMYVSVFKN